jgi:hypothetical protein
LKEWLGIEGIFPRQWVGLNIQAWWSSLVKGTSMHRKGLSLLTLLRASPAVEGPQAEI